MHQSAYEAMRRSVDRYVPQDRRLRVVDLGSAARAEAVHQGKVHGALFAGYDAEVIGVDIARRPNVDIVLEEPYRVPLRSNSVDVVVSGQTFEHIPFFWATTLEIARLLTPGGLFIVTVPSRGHPHMTVDCWRFYDDGVRALAAFSGLIVRQAHTDFPVQRDVPGRFFDVESDPTCEHYWGDTVGVLQKPLGYPTRRMAVVRAPVVWWANRTAPMFDRWVKADPTAKSPRARGKLPRRRRRQRAAAGAGAGRA